MLNNALKWKMSALNLLQLCSHLLPFFSTQTPLSGQLPPQNDSAAGSTTTKGRRRWFIHGGCRWRLLPLCRCNGAVAVAVMDCNVAVAVAVSEDVAFTPPWRR